VASGPNTKNSLDALLTDALLRLKIVERRIAIGSSGFAVRNYGAVQSTTAQGSITTTPVAVPGISLPITMPDNGRLRFQGQVVTYSSSVNDVVSIRLLDGGSEVWSWSVRANSGIATASTGHAHTLIAEADVATGAHTYTLDVARVVGSGNVTIGPTSNSPNLLSIDRIG